MPAFHPPEGFVTTAEIARRTGEAVSSVSSWALNALIQTSPERGPKRAWLIPESEAARLEELFAGRRRLSKFAKANQLPIELVSPLAQKHLGEDLPTAPDGDPLITPEHEERLHSIADPFSASAPSQREFLRNTLSAEDFEERAQITHLALTRILNAFGLHSIPIFEYPLTHHSGTVIQRRLPREFAHALIQACAVPSVRQNIGTAIARLAKAHKREFKQTTQLHQQALAEQESALLWPNLVGEAHPDNRALNRDRFIEAVRTAYQGNRESAQPLFALLHYAALNRPTEVSRILFAFSRQPQEAARIAATPRIELTPRGFVKVVNQLHKLK